MTGDGVDAVLDELVQVLAEKVEHRRAVDDQLLPRQYELLARIAELGVPKTGAGGIAPRVHARLAAAGWPAERIVEAGISEGSVRQAIDRVRR